MRIPFLGNKKKKQTKHQERFGRKRKEHVTLPIIIPQNIIDWFIGYREWRKDQSAFPKGHKYKMLDQLEEIGKKWHLYAGWQNVAGSTWMWLNNGLVLLSHISEDKPIIIRTVVCGKEYDHAEDRKQIDESTYDDRDYVYHWDNYTPVTIE